MSDEYAVERIYICTGQLENGDVIVRTEYGSLLSQTLLKVGVVTQLEKALRYLQKGQRLRVYIEVLNDTPAQKEG
jgi:hypothetical protein